MKVTPQYLIKTNEIFGKFVFSNIKQLIDIDGHYCLSLDEEGVLKVFEYPSNLFHGEESDCNLFFDNINEVLSSTDEGDDSSQQNFRAQLEYMVVPLETRDRTPLKAEKVQKIKQSTIAVSSSMLNYLIIMEFIEIDYENMNMTINMKYVDFPGNLEHISPMINRKSLAVVISSNKKAKVFVYNTQTKTTRRISLNKLYKSYKGTSQQQFTYFNGTPNEKSNKINVSSFGFIQVNTKKKITKDFFAIFTTHKESELVIFTMTDATIKHVSKIKPSQKLLLLAKDTFGLLGPKGTDFLRWTENGLIKICTVQFGILFRESFVQFENRVIYKDGSYIKSVAFFPDAKKYLIEWATPIEYPQIEEIFAIFDKNNLCHIFFNIPAQLKRATKGKLLSSWSNCPQDYAKHLNMYFNFAWKNLGYMQAAHSKLKDDAILYDAHNLMDEEKYDFNILKSLLLQEQNQKPFTRSEKNKKYFSKTSKQITLNEYSCVIKMKTTPSSLILLKYNGYQYLIQMYSLENLTTKQQFKCIANVSFDESGALQFFLDDFEYYEKTKILVVMYVIKDVALFTEDIDSLFESYSPMICGVMRFLNQDFSSFVEEINIFNVMPVKQLFLGIVEEKYLLFICLYIERMDDNGIEHYGYAKLDMNQPNFLLSQAKTLEVIEMNYFKKNKKKISSHCSYLSNWIISFTFSDTPNEIIFYSLVEDVCLRKINVDPQGQVIDFLTIGFNKIIWAHLNKESKGAFFGVYNFESDLSSNFTLCKHNFAGFLGSQEDVAAQCFHNIFFVSESQDQKKLSLHLLTTYGDENIGESNRVKNDVILNKRLFSKHGNRVLITDQKGSNDNPLELITITNKKIILLQILFKALSSTYNEPIINDIYSVFEQKQTTHQNFIRKNSNFISFMFFVLLLVTILIKKSFFYDCLNIFQNLCCQLLLFLLLPMLYRLIQDYSQTVYPSQLYCKSIVFHGKQVET